jgi:hypothetical protein
LATGASSEESDRGETGLRFVLRRGA